jgi:ABC-type nickel/cobalt efflux system permease component RcnA
MSPTPNLLAISGIGLLLGFRHAFEPDHLAAVSTLATRPGARLWSAARLGLVWGVGHTTTVGVVVGVILVLGLELPPSLWPAAELLVAALLVLLGSVVIWRYARGRWHMHTHMHAGTDEHLHLHSHAHVLGHVHSHLAPDARRSLGFGIAHGLAGSGAIAALLVAAAPDTASRLTYFLTFGLGTILGMLLVSMILAFTVRFASGRGARWATVVHVGSATLSVMVGFGLGINTWFRL